ncbi:hypothetical protein [Streptomyces sp. NPDC007100]|uniref:hypothetical protein n=1 Tax=Streptomyces sp. NPDC007100 TaxID=3155602 RepID=UPI0033E07566
MKATFVAEQLAASLRSAARSAESTVRFQRSLVETPSLAYVQYAPWLAAAIQLGPCHPWLGSGQS